MSLVGGNIDAYCMKCKLVLAHVIMFKLKGAVDRVKCNTCGAEHKYRPAAPLPKVPAELVGSTRKSPPKKATTVKAPASDASIQWDLKSRNIQAGANIKSYSISASYQLRDVINHPVFGVGFVERIVSDKSAYVLFKDSVRLMGMNVA